MPLLFVALQNKDNRNLHFSVGFYHIFFTILASVN